MSLIVIPFIFSPGTTIVSSQINSCFSTIFNDYNGNVGDVNLSSSLTITDSHLAQITSTGKVSATALTNMGSLPGGAGTVPVANLPVGVSVGNIVQLVSGTTPQLPAVGGNYLTGVTQTSILNYGSSPSSSSSVAQNTLKIAYGTTAIGTSATVNITNLNFSSSSTYVVSLGWLGDTRISQQYPISIAYISGSSFSISSQQGTYTQNVSWIAIGY